MYKNENKILVQKIKKKKENGFMVEQYNTNQYKFIILH